MYNLIFFNTLTKFNLDFLIKTNSKLAKDYSKKENTFIVLNYIKTQLKSFNH